MEAADILETDAYMTCRGCGTKIEDDQPCYRTSLGGIVCGRDCGRDLAKETGRAIELFPVRMGYLD